MKEQMGTVLTGGSVYRDGTLTRADLAVRDGRIAAIGDSTHWTGVRVVDATDQVITPGLVDLHTHVYWGAGRLGVNPDKNAARTGVTTWVDAGSAGAGNLEGLVHHVARPATVRILPFLNVSYIGLTAAGMPTREVGELNDPAFADLAAILRAAEEMPGIITGLKLRASANAIGNNTAVVLPLAREAADLLAVPLMVHIGMAPPTIDQVLPFLHAGDVVTHCYHPHPGGSVLDRQHLLKPSVLDAAQRGVLFDVGHGVASMSHHVARAALDQGLLPDTISSDLHAENIDSVLHGLPSVMDKFLAFGLSINDVLQRVTEAPARALRRPELGSLEPGNPADLTVFSIRSCDRQVQDAVGDHLRLSQTFIHRRTFVAGQELAPIDDGRVESRSSPWATRFGATIDNRP